MTPDLKERLVNLYLHDEMVSCKKCKHHIIDRTMGVDYLCTVNNIDEQAYAYAEYMRDRGPCGPEARYFESR